MNSLPACYFMNSLHRRGSGWTTSRASSGTMRGEAYFPQPVSRRFVLSMIRLSVVYTKSESAAGAAERSKAFASAVGIWKNRSIRAHRNNRDNRSILCAHIRLFEKSGSREGIAFALYVCCCSTWSTLPFSRLLPCSTRGEICPTGTIWQCKGGMIGIPGFASDHVIRFETPGICDRCFQQNA